MDDKKVGKKTDIDRVMGIEMPERTRVCSICNTVYTPGDTFPCVHLQIHDEGRGKYE